MNKVYRAQSLTMTLAPIKKPAKIVQNAYTSARRTRGFLRAKRSRIIPPPMPVKTAATIVALIGKFNFWAYRAPCTANADKPMASVMFSHFFQCLINLLGKRK